MASCLKLLTLCWSWSGALAVHLRNSTGPPTCVQERLAATAMDFVGIDRERTLQDAGLDAIYVLHWKRAWERRPRAEAELWRVGLRAAFVTGWDAEEFSDEDLRCLYPSNKNFDALAKKFHWALSWFNTGELSLSMKHAAAHFDAVKRGYRNILVLEDDFTFASNFTQVLADLLLDRKAWEKPGKPYSILFIGSYSTNVKAMIPITKPETTPDGINRGTIGYVISDVGAKHVLRHLPVDAPSDHMLSNNECSTAPPNRYIHRPYLIEPHFDFQPGAGHLLATPKKSNLIRTPDLVDCVGTKCPCSGHAKNVTPWTVRNDCCCKSTYAY